jgi:hypothetical protein
MSAAASNGGRARFDLDKAAQAALAEANPVPFAFTWKGKDYDVPAAVTWPLEVQALISKGELDRALTMLLGAEVYERLIASGMTVGDLTVLFEAVAGESGVGSLPNSLPRAGAASTRT